MRIFIILFCILAATLAAQAQTSEVDFLKQLPGPIQPRSLVLSGPFADGTIMGTTNEVGGIYCSHNSGRSFTRCEAEGLEKIIPLYAEVSHNSRGVLFFDNNLENFRSTDSGSTWSVCPGVTPQTIRFLIVTLPTIRVVYQEINDSTWKILRSRDDGQTWDTIRTFASPPESALHLLTNSAGTLLLYQDDTLYRGRDEGDTWTTIGKWALPVVPSFQSTGSIFLNMELSTGRIWRSTDEGGTWIENETGLPPGVPMSVALRQNDGRVIAVMGDNSLYGTSDSAATWQRLGTTPPSTVINSSSVSILWFGRTILLSRYGELLRSEDNGANWSRIPLGQSNGSAVWTMLPIADGGLLATEASTGTLYRTRDHGENWDSLGQVTTFTGEGALAMTRNSRDELFAGTGGVNGGNVYRSVDGGMTWKPITHGLSNAGNIWDITTVGQDTLLIATSGNGIFRSSDRGDTWMKSTVPQTNGVYSLLVAANGSIFAGTDGVGVWQSNDGGRTWFRANIGIASPTIFGLHQTRNGTLLAGGLGALFRSLDNGKSWTKSRQSPGRGPTSTDGGEYPRTFVETSDGVLYCGTWTYWFCGLYSSTDGGDTWLLASQYPHIGNIFHLALDRDGYLYAGTNGLGVWRSLKSTGVASVAERVVESKDIEVRVAGDAIHYRISEAGHVRLALCDALGREVRMLLNDAQESGEHTLSFETASLPSGTYLLRLTVADRSSTIPLIVTH